MMVGSSIGIVVNPVWRKKELTDHSPVHQQSKRVVDCGLRDQATLLIELLENFFC